jgi:hypothetical protein
MRGASGIVLSQVRAPSTGGYGRLQPLPTLASGQEEAKRRGERYDMGKRRQALSVLIVSTLAFTVCFMVWMMFGVIGIPIKRR